MRVCGFSAERSSTMLKVLLESSEFNYTSSSFITEGFKNSKLDVNPLDVHLKLDFHGGILWAYSRRIQRRLSFGPPEGSRNLYVRSVCLTSLNPGSARCCI